MQLALPLLFVLVALSQWLLGRAKRNLTIEDKARLADITFRPWWVMLVFAAIFSIWSFGFRSIPHQWYWASLLGLMLAVFAVSVASAAIQWRALVRSEIAQHYVRTQLWTSVVIYTAMLLFFAALLYDARILRHR